MIMGLEGMKMSKENTRTNYLLEVKKRQIKEFKEEIAAQAEIIQILSSFIAEGVEKQGTVEILREKIAEGIKCGYTIEVTEDKYILRKAGGDA